MILALKKILVHIMCQPFVGNIIGRIFDDKIPSRGCVIFTDSPIIIPSSKASLFWGFYEGAEVRFVQKYISRDCDVIEIGSSIGVVSSNIARRLNPAKRLVCVEADPRLASIICQNIEANAPEANVILETLAVAYSVPVGEKVCFTLAERHVDSRVSRSGNEDSMSIGVPSATLTSIVEKYSIDRFALVCDIEGAEKEIIENEFSALEKCNLIIIELHDTETPTGTVTAEGLGKRIEQLHGFRQIDGKGRVRVFAR